MDAPLSYAEKCHALWQVLQASCPITDSPTSDQNQLLLHTRQRLSQGWHANTNTNINKHYFQRPQILQIHSLEMCRRVLGGT